MCRLIMYRLMFDPSSPTNSEAPPQAAGQSHSAAQLKQHPLWARASGLASPMPPVAGRGRGRGKAAHTPPDPDGGARYERISLLAVELQQCATGADGADSALMSSEDEEDEENEEDAWNGGMRHRDYDNEEQDCEDEYEADGLSTAGSDQFEFKRAKTDNKKGSSSKSNKQPCASDIMAATAFGGGENLFGEGSDNASVMSRTSSKRKKDSLKQAFPVKGVTCVGCALANRIAPVEKFINGNVGRISEQALWKMAALTWKLEVVEPAKKEGVHVMDWAWRDVANHFRLHTTNQVVGRTHMIQSLTAMRCQVEQRLVRVENGERELDKVNTDLCLKV